MIFVNVYHSPLGDMTMASEEGKLSGLWFEGQKYYGSTLMTEYKTKDLDIFEQTARWLDIYFEGKNPGDIPPILFNNATPFRRSVWQILEKIPYGKTITYGEIAKIISDKNGIKGMYAQAVGNAIGHNPISIIIPCHRVVGTNGSLTGYAGGIDKKIELLKLENINTQKFFIPKEKNSKG